MCLFCDCALIEVLSDRFGEHKSDKTITYQHRLHVSEVSRCFHCSSNHEAQSATQTEDGIPVLRTDCGDGVHREEFSHTRAFAIVLVLGLNACFVLFWSRLLFLVFLSDGTH